MRRFRRFLRSPAASTIVAVLLVELACQGLAALSLPGGSLRLRPGYNVLAVDGAALRRLVEALLHPSPRDAEALRATGASGRAGTTFSADDGFTYRLVRTFGGECQLQRFDAQKRAFSLVGHGPSEEGAALAASAGAPSREVLALLTIRATDLPSRQAMAAGAGVAPAVHVPAPRPPTDPARRRAELKTELERARSAEKLQARQDELANRGFKADEALREEAKLRDAAEAAREAAEAAGPALEVLHGLGAGPKEVEARFASCEKSRAKRDEVLARCAQEREALDEATRRGAPAPFWLDPRFLAGVVAGVAAVLAAAFASSPGSGLRYLALLDLPAFGWAAWVALGWVSASEAHGRLGRRRQLVDEHARKAEEAFARETVELSRAMKALSVASPAELKEALGRAAEAEAAVTAARARADEVAARPEVAAARAEKAALETELRQVEAKLAELSGGYLRDVRSVELELQRLEAPPAEEPTPQATTALPPREEAHPAVDPVRACLEAAAAELGGSPAGAAREVEARASQLAQALSGNRMSAVGVDDRGNLRATVGGRLSPLASLTPPDRDLAYLALRLAFVERLFTGARRIALVDDALGALPEPGRRAAGRVLKAMARTGQILHATTDLAFRESADHVA